MTSKKNQTLSPFPQYVSKVQRVITDQKHQWFATDITRRKRGRSSRLLQCSAEVAPNPKPPQRQKPLPRTLSPLHKLRRKPSPNVLMDPPRSGRGLSPRIERELGERGASGASHLAVPAPGFYRQGQSSCASSNSSSPVPTSLVTIQLGCKSKESLSSASSDQSPPAFKRGTPTSLNVVGESDRAQPAVQLQRTHSQNSLSMQRACSKSPYVAPLGVAKKLRRKRVQQLENSKQSHQTHVRNHGDNLKTTHSRETLVTPATLVSRDAQPVSQCTVKIWSAPEDLETPMGDMSVGTLAIPTLLEDSDSSLCIPTITIRSATPVIKAPNDEDNLMTLCEKLAFRADMADELDRLREEIRALSGTSDDAQQTSITH